MSVLTDNLKLLIHANNDWLDASGNGNNGTATGATFSTSAKLGSHCGSFDGVDDRVGIANESNFDFERTDPISMSAWIYPDTANTYDMIIGKDDMNSSPRRGWTFYLNPAGGL